MSSKLHLQQSDFVKYNADDGSDGGDNDNNSTCKLLTKPACCRLSVICLHVADLHITNHCYLYMNVVYAYVILLYRECD